MAIFIRKGGRLEETNGRKIQAELDVEKQEKARIQREKEYELARIARQRELEYELIRKWENIKKNQQISEEIGVKERETAERTDTKQKVIQQMNTLMARHFRKRQNV